MWKIDYTRVDWERTLQSRSLVGAKERKAVYAKPILPRSHIANLFGTNSNALGGRFARDPTGGEWWRRSCLLGGRSVIFFQVLSAAPVSFFACRCCYFLLPTS
ncbi:hypothetical protein NE237_020249 [Protea cynaroides]|uniref:Uncharacterized protein n=1 Tax=Protea cynaroides TaxID=273540 RepID=A0A9Q0HAQ5_9MAGN|nr:hypothetical protein NE237_020249 [Protea cynaroides]